MTSAGWIDTLAAVPAEGRSRGGLVARRNRAGPSGRHSTRRGNDRQPCFGSRADFTVHAHRPWEAPRRLEVAVHARVFVTDHVQSLATPAPDDGTTGMMRHLGRRHVRCFDLSADVAAPCGSAAPGPDWSRIPAISSGAAGTASSIPCVRACVGSRRIPSVGLPRQCARNVVGAVYAARGVPCAWRGGGGLAAYRAPVAPRVDDGPIADTREATQRGLALGDERFMRGTAAPTGTRSRTSKPGPGPKTRQRRPRRVRRSRAGRESDPENTGKQTRNMTRKTLPPLSHQNSEVVLSPRPARGSAPPESRRARGRRAAARAGTGIPRG